MTQKIKVGDYVKVVDETGNHAYSGTKGKVFRVEAANSLSVTCKGFNGASMLATRFELVSSPKTHKTVTLELTEDEANTIYALVGSVEGCFVNSPRKHCDSVYHKMKSMLGHGSIYTTEFAVLKRNIEFKDYLVVKTPQQLKIEELEDTIKEAQKQVQELKGL